MQKKKLCPACKTPRRIKDFTKNRSRKDGLHHSCKFCQREYVRGHYERNKSYYLKKARTYDKAFRRWIQSQKEMPCADCEVEYPYYVMDFDHVRGKKLFTLSSAMSDTKSKKKVMGELAKCDVVCANCHRIRSWKRKNLHARVV